MTGSSPIFLDVSYLTKSCYSQYVPIFGASGLRFRECGLWFQNVRFLSFSHVPLTTKELAWSKTKGWPCLLAGTLRICAWGRTLFNRGCVSVINSERERVFISDPVHYRLIFPNSERLPRGGPTIIVGCSHPLPDLPMAVDQTQLLDSWPGNTFKTVHCLTSTCWNWITNKKWTILLVFIATSSQWSRPSDCYVPKFTTGKALAYLREFP